MRSAGFGQGFKRAGDGGTSGDRFGSGGAGATGTKSSSQRGFGTSKDEAEVTRKMGSLSLGDAREVMAAKMPPGESCTAQEKIITNVFGVRLPDVTVYMYDIGVTGITDKNKEVDMTRRSRDDYPSLLRKQLCCAVFYIISIQEGTSIFEDCKVFYDGQKMLFTFDKLYLGPQGRRTFKVTFAEYDMKFENFVEARLTIQPTLGTSEFSLNDINAQEQNRSILQFVDIASSQTIFFRPDKFLYFPGGISYLLRPEEEGFEERDVPDLPEKKFVGVGTHKSSLAIEGSEGRGQAYAAIAIDTSKTAFHLNVNVFEKANSVVPGFAGRRLDPRDVSVIRQQLTGLFVERRVNEESVIFQIWNVSDKTSRQTTFVYEGTDVSVYDYYRVRYHVEIKNADAPVLVSKGPGGKGFSYFPMELCWVLEKQRVKKMQQTPLQLREMRNACIIPPALRQHQNELNVKAIELLSEENQYMFGCNIRPWGNPLTVDSRILPLPTVSYGGNQQVRIDMEKLWTLARNTYMIPATVPMWAFYVISGDSRVSKGDIDEFIKRLISAGKSHGMRFCEYADCNKIPEDRQAIETTIKIAANEGCEFIFFVQNDAAKFHECIKDMEQRYSVITQDMKFSKLLEVVQRGRWQTLENVVNKMNIKLGGVNYGVAPPAGGNKVLSDGRMFVGITLSNPEPDFRALRPTAVGYAANCKSQNYEFVGDFCFHGARRTELTSSVEFAMQRMLQQYMTNRKKLPSEVIIYRGGVAEGQYEMLLSEEIPRIRRTLKEEGCDSVKLTFIVVNKLHNIRFFSSKINPSDNPQKQNVKIGTVLDTAIVHPKYNEFFLNSHKSLQGTARVPRYTVIVDDLRMPMDELETMTYTLCFCHQIVNLPTSTPTPFYVATRYAERGRVLMAERCFDPEGVSSAGGAVHVDLEELNRSLPYFSTPLAQNRINA